MLKIASFCLLSLLIVVGSIHADDYDPDTYFLFGSTLYFGSDLLLRDETAEMLPGNNPSSIIYISGAVIQLIKDGGDAVISPPDSTGQPTGDDILLLSTRIGVGVPVLLDEQGMFSVVCNFSDYSDTLYARIFNSADLATATYYGQTSLYALNAEGEYGDRWFTVDDHGLTCTNIPLDSQGDYVAVADTGGPYVADEGVPIMLDASATTDQDTDPQELTYVWDFNDDGIFEEATGTMVFFVAPDNGDKPIAVKAVNSQSGTAGIAFTTVTVSNVQPEITQVPDQTAIVDTKFTVSTTYSDSGVADTHTVTVNWGDSNIDSDIPVGSGIISLSHYYEVIDDYTVEITVYDDDGASSSTIFNVVMEGSSSIPTTVTPLISISDGMLISWATRQGFIYEIWFKDGSVTPFDQNDPDWNIIDITIDSSYTDTGDADGFDDMPDSADDRLPPAEVDSRFYVIREVVE